MPTRIDGRVLRDSRGPPGVSRCRLMGVSEPELRKDWLKPVFPLDKRFYYQSVARNPGDYQILAHRSTGASAPAARQQDLLSGASTGSLSGHVRSAWCHGAHQECWLDTSNGRKTIRTRSRVSETAQRAHSPALR